MANETMNLNTPILTLDSDTVLETAQSKADLIWHDIQNAYRTRKILTGILGGIEKTEAGSLIAIIFYKDYRAIIPISEITGCTAALRRSTNGEAKQMSLPYSPPSPSTRAIKASITVLHFLWRNGCSKPA